MPPILFIAFNRPDLAARTFACIRKAKPSRLYIAADAPRDDRPGERELTRQTRAVIEQVDWDCDVTRLFADENMGCGRRISSAITRVLNENESAIILEDDCLPDPSFFGYCDALLERFAEDQRVMAVSGDNFQAGSGRELSSYYFSKYPHCWGWATWRRAWNHFDLQISRWPDFRDSDGLESFCHQERELRFWRSVLDDTHAGKIDTWDLQWTLACWMQNGLTALPIRNLVSNIGFRADGTHTTGQTAYANLPRSSMGTLVHPIDVHANSVRDRFTDELLYSGPWQRQLDRERKPWRRLKRRLRRVA